MNDSRSGIIGSMERVSNSGKSERRKREKAERDFTALVHVVGPQVVSQVFESFEKLPDDLRGVVAVPAEETEYGIAVSDDGSVHVQIAHQERFNIPLERAKEITENVARQQT